MFIRPYRSRYDRSSEITRAGRTVVFVRGAIKRARDNFSLLFPLVSLLLHPYGGMRT